MSSPRIVYVSRSDSTREAQASALANVYRFALDSANRNAVAMTNTDGSDAMKGLRNDRAKTSIHE